MTSPDRRKLDLALAKFNEYHKKSRSDKAFGFYWTRKNIDLASYLVEEFSPLKSVILDPFLGSGSSALGAIRAKGGRLFAGIELNEMPIANLLFTLGKYIGINLSHENEARKALSLIKDLYIFQYDDQIYEISKIVHNFEDGVLTPATFITNGSKNLHISRENEPELFAYLLEEYFNRISLFQPKEDLDLSPNSRIAIKDGMQVSDVFGQFGFEALSMLRKEALDKQLLQLLVAASVHLCRLTDAKSQSQFPFWYPKQEIHEKSVYEVVSKKLRELLLAHQDSVQYSEVHILDEYSEWSGEKDTSLLIAQGNTATTLKEILPLGSVDLIITDPPYFDQVAYSEYLKLWEFFTGFKSNLEDEIVESARVGATKNRAIFLKDLEQAFREIRKVTKDSAFAIVYFKDSKPVNLHDFISCLGRAGFGYISQVHLEKATFTYKQNNSPESTVGGDSIMIFQPVDPGSFIEPTTEVSIEELDSKFLDLFETYINIHGPSTLTAALDNHIIHELYPTGYLSKIKSSSHFSKIAKVRFDFDPLSREWDLKNE